MGNHDPFINRELSWLSFNERVLEEATDPATPLFERLKFASIVASNLDEFFMVRVARLKHAAEEGDDPPDPGGMTPYRQLDAIHTRAHAQMEALYTLVMRELLPSLRHHEICIVPLRELSDGRRAALSTYFREAILPVLTPLAIDVSRPFPLLSSLSLNLAVMFEPGPGETQPRLALVQVPSRIARLLRLPQTAGATFVLLEDVIREHLPDLFPGQPVTHVAAIRLARDSELELDDEGGHSHLEVVERELKRRRRGDVVRMEVESAVTSELLELLSEQLQIAAEDVYRVPGLLDVRVLSGLVDLPGYEELRDPPAQPADPLADEPQADDLFALLDRHDVLLHHPYDSYDPVVALTAQAADDPDVLAIKITLYRTSAGSPIIENLQRAADQNKQVTVLLELTARFDEERNIRWARSLEEAGAHVIHGIVGYKTHAKICLIVRRGPRGLQRYVHLGTGNYNDRTARVYTDFGLMTANAAFAEDATAFFSALTGYSDPPRLRKLIMAPTDLRRRFLKLIDRERRRAEAGQPAEIAAKMNAVTDEEIVRALYAASRAGVRIRLNVRGMCILTPGVPDVSANIEVVSIVDRFLEHSRVYYFLNGGEEQVYLSSADWMTRNLDKRIELMFPVESPDARARVLSALQAMFRDTVKARCLGPDGVYRRRSPEPGEEPFRAQQYLQDEARRRASLARGSAGVRFEPATLASSNSRTGGGTARER